jgi:hypothetical protein
MSNKPNIKIKGKIQDMNKKEKNVKPKHSNFLLTINTNQQYKENDEHLQDDIEIFDESIKTILNNIDQYINLPETDKWDDNTIKDVDVDYVIERGGKKGQLHIHILFKFKHHSRLQLNYEKIKDKLKTDLGLQNVYMYNRLIRNNGSENVLDYLSKMT